MTMPNVLDEADHPLDRSGRILFQTERQCQVEEHLGIGRSLNIRIQRLVYGQREIALYEMEVPDEAVVDPQPIAVTEGVAVGLLYGGAGGGADVGQEQRRVHVAGDLSEVAVVPGRLDTPEDGGGFDCGGVPADAEAVAVCGIHAHAGVSGLVYEGVLGFVEQLLDEDGRS